MPRRFGVAALCLWPGLPQIWSGQEVLGLILACLFAATVNLAVVTQFIWTESVAPGWPAFFASLAVVTWLAGLGYTWNEARRRFEQILAMDETDADALMQLGTLYVRTDQPTLARRSFRQCLELEAGAKWRWEISQILARLGDE
jgi:hypothetical protein